jgi:hypothetical protein
MWGLRVQAFHVGLCCLYWRKIKELDWDRKRVYRSCRELGN